MMMMMMMMKKGKRWNMKKNYFNLNYFVDPGMDFIKC